jgi:hypothetical protein
MSLIFKLLNNGTDGSAYAHAITNSVGPACILGKGVEIPAANENGYIQIGAVNNLNTRGNLGFTVSQWVKLGRVGVTQVLLNIWGDSGAGNQSWLTYSTETNYILIATYDGAGTSTLTGTTTALIANRWYHIVCVYDGGTTGTNGHIYINGVVEIEGTISKVPQQSTNYAMRFGCDYARTASIDLVGSGQDLRFYDDAKSADWAKLTYLQTRNGF